LLGTTASRKHSHSNVKKDQHIKKTNKIRIASLNAQCGKRLDRIVDEFTAPHLAACDLILLQEVEEEGRFSQAEDLARRLGYVNCVYMPARPTKNGTHGLAILSRQPLEDVERLDLPRYELIINTRDRMAIGATVHFGRHRLRVYNVHLDTRISAIRRQQQLHPVIMAAGEHGHTPTIIGGDFNTFSPKHTEHVDELLSDAGFSSPFLDGSHYTAKFLFWRPQLDWIYARHLRVVSAKVEHEIVCSDHRPLWVDADFSK
jgi:endonuclease/exonuclease/phosphatase family metal-dependent hydrolase